MINSFASFTFQRIVVFFRLPGLAILLGLLLSASTSASEQELKLVFGLYTADKPTALVKEFRPMLTAIEADLSKALGRPTSIRMHISPTYKSGIKALVNEEVDFARFGPASYVDAFNQNSNLRIIALDSKDGTSTFKGVICIHENSNLTKPSDLKGTRFAFGNEGSTIGRYLSQAFLVKHGITENDLESYAYLDRHDRVGHAVANGSFDAGALKHSTFKKLREKGLPIKALAEFDNVNKPWVARSGMDEDLFKALQKVLFEISDKDAFKALDRKQFVKGIDSDFREIRNAINNNSLFFQDEGSVHSAASDDQ